MKLVRWLTTKEKKRLDRENIEVSIVTCVHHGIKACGVKKEIKFMLILIKVKNDKNCKKLQFKKSYI